MRTIDLPARKTASRTAKLTAWLIAVARAAPAVPISNVNMKSGSRKTFRTPPIPSPHIAMRDSPSARSVLLSTNEAQLSGAAARIYFAYPTAYGSIVSVHLSRRSIGPSAARQPQPTAAPVTTAAKKALEAYISAALSFFSPSLRLIRLPAPIPSP